MKRVLPLLQSAGGCDYNEWILSGLSEVLQVEFSRGLKSRKKKKMIHSSKKDFSQLDNLKPIIIKLLPLKHSLHNLSTFMNSTYKPFVNHVVF